MRGGRGGRAITGAMDARGRRRVREVTANLGVKSPLKVRWEVKMGGKGSKDRQQGETAASSSKDRQQPAAAGTDSSYKKKQIPVHGPLG